MNLDKKFQLHRFMSDVEKLVEDRDLKITIETDFAEYRRLRHAQNDRPELMHLFDPKMGFVPKNTSFWVKCENKDGVMVHSQAVRKHDLGISNLYDHIEDSRLLYAPHEVHDIEDYKIHMSEAFKNFTGAVSYHGDAWIHSSLRSSRLSMVFGRYALAAAKMFWNAETYFAIMSGDSVTMGLDKRAGFFNARPAQWKCGDEMICRYWLVWLEQEDLDDLVAIPPEEVMKRRAR